MFKRQEFKNKEIINKKDVGNYEGASVNCWHLNKDDLSELKEISTLICAIKTLHKIHKQSDTNKIKGLIKLLKSTPKSKIKKIELKQIIASLNIACLLYYKRTKCLEWACV